MLIKRSNIKGSPLLDSMPFRMWLIGRFRIYNYNIDEFARVLEMDASRLRKLIDGYDWSNGTGRSYLNFYGPQPITYVSLDIVDKCLTLDGMDTISDLYPYIEYWDG